MKLTHVDSLGFHFTNNGKFCKSNYQNTHLIANTLVQIKPTVEYWLIGLMKENDVTTNNKDWLEKNKYRYLSRELRTKFGSYDQSPSSVNYKPLKVFMLQTEIAEQLLATNLLYLSERTYKDISSLIKSKYLHNFKYELPGKLIELPTSTVPKQTTHLVKVGNQLISRPVRKVS